MIKNLSSFTHKIKLNRGLDGVLVTPTQMIASDSYKLIELNELNTGVTDPIVIILPKGVKTFERISHAELIHTRTDKKALLNLNEKQGLQSLADTLPADTFPDYKRIIPITAPLFTITLSPEHLKEICTAFTGELMRISLWDKNKPLLIEGNAKRAILMPIQS